MSYEPHVDVGVRLRRKQLEVILRGLELLIPQCKTRQEMLSAQSARTRIEAALADLRRRV